MEHELRKSIHRLKSAWLGVPRKERTLRFAGVLSFATLYSPALIESYLAIAGRKAELSFNLLTGNLM
jgi:hypothetical protein